MESIPPKRGDDLIIIKKGTTKDEIFDLILEKKQAGYSSLMIKFDDSPSPNKAEFDIEKFFQKQKIVFEKTYEMIMKKVKDALAKKKHKLELDFFDTYCDSYSHIINIDPFKDMAVKKIIYELREKHYRCIYEIISKHNSRSPMQQNFNVKRLTIYF